MDKTKLLLVLIVSAIGVTGAEAADQRMNVRFLAADDPNSWLLEDADRYAGKVVAPNLRRLAGRHDVREDLADYLGEALAWDGMFNELMEELKAQVRNVAADSGYAKFLRELTDRDEVVAVGETGLDYFRDFSPRDHQRHAFERQLEIAVNTGLPLFLHQRDAHPDFIAILRQVRDKLHEVVVHCFTGSQAELHECLDLDCHIGITGWICDERRGTHMKAWMSDIPANRLMIETDAPYLKPRNMRPKVKSHRNEPCWLPWIAGTLAACRRETPEQLARQSTSNAREFFRLNNAMPGE